jgi:hypothetical protein
MKWRTGDDDDNDDLEKKAKRSSGYSVVAPNKKPCPAGVSINLAKVEV